MIWIDDIITHYKSERFTYSHFAVGTALFAGIATYIHAYLTAKIDLGAGRGRKEEEACK